MANFITADGKTELDIRVLAKGEPNKVLFQLSNALSRFNTNEVGAIRPVHVYAFRVVFTAGMALPFCQLIMSSNKREELETFVETNENTIEFTYGNTIGNKSKITVQCETAGSFIRDNKLKDMHILYWGGVLKKDGVGMSFLRDKMSKYALDVKGYDGTAYDTKSFMHSGSYNGTALDALKRAWWSYSKDGMFSTNLGTEVDLPKDEQGNEDIRETISSSHKYRIWGTDTVQNYMMRLFLHIDLRPSFPMVYIDKNLNLVIRDFDKLKMAGPTTLFVPADLPDTGLSKAQKRILNKVRYSGDANPVSFRTYTDRTMGYTEINARDINKGTYSIFSSDIGDITDKDIDGDEKNFNAIQSAIKGTSPASSVVGAINNFENTSKKKFQFKKKKTKVKTGATDESMIKSPLSKSSVVRTTQQVVIGSDTPKAFHESCLHNKQNLTNMSAFQLKVRVPDQYLDTVNVLDYVEVAPAINQDSRTKGCWVVEAKESGFVNGKSNNVIYLCRDYLNESGTLLSGTFADYIEKWLGFGSDQKEWLAECCNSARNATVICRNILDKTYLNEYQSYLVNMKSAALSNFNIFGTQLNLTSAAARAMTLRNLGEMLSMKLIRALLKDPYANFFVDLLRGSANIFGFLMMLLSSVLGGPLFSAISMLLATLRSFNLFLRNYHSAISVAIQESSPYYSGVITSGTISFTETPSGDIITDITNSGTDSTLLERLKTVRKSKEEILEDIKQDIVDDILDSLPEDIDIPIPDIVLDEEDLPKEHDEIVDIIVDDIVEGLEGRDYVYNIDGAEPDTYVIDKVDKEGNAEIITLEDGRQRLTSDCMKKVLKDSSKFSPQLIKVLKNTVDNTIKIRHWGTFNTYNDLSSFNMASSYIDKYKTVNATKALTCLGQRIFVALPSTEENVKFYVNSERNYELENNTMEFADIGYYDGHGNPIPYIIYYTTEYFDNINLTLEMRKN